ncbi:unnamed protein product [Clonostachys rosea]|uniref:MARVEL domain-containing protein n=1 Tax=Bionectria ochroleuca TaxID=29856 RepID=A0ABY6U4B5_BIOOC|nr:unnamed protein product [Clonostachys rosea]
MKIFIIIAYLSPVFLSIIGLILSTLCLYSGNAPGIMEDFALARLNVTMIGQDLTDIDDGPNHSTSPRSQPDPIRPRPGNKDDENTVSSIINLIVGFLNGLVDIYDGSSTNPQVDIGLSDWYSFHVMTACRGEFTNSSLLSMTRFRPTNCTHAKLGFRFNLTELMAEDLKNSGVNIDLGNYAETDQLQKKLDILNRVLSALAAFYIMTMVFCALALLYSFISLFSDNHTVSRLGLLSILLATLALIVASGIATVAAKQSSDEVTKLGREVGIESYRGYKFLGLTWGAAAAMFLDIFFQIAQVRRTREELKSTKETHGGESDEEA